MTGIAGAFGPGPIDAGLVDDMARVLAHRGTADIRMTPHAAVAGFQRDPAAGAHAALYADGALVVLFDGELDQADLAPGQRRPTGELVAHLYRQHGPALLDRLEGPFALAIIDGSRILLARDAIGVRPLYTRRCGNMLLFASEAKALLRGPSAPDIDMEALLERYVFTDHTLGTTTMFRDVQSLRPGSGIVAEASSSGVELMEIEAGNGAAATPAEIREIVERNVRYSLERYRTVGVLLSGGFDSSVLACLAQKHSPGRIRTFTIGDSETYPDVQAARQVARHLGTEHHEILIDTPDPRDLVWGIHAYEDLTYRDSLFILARRMAGLADVALSGSGADLLGTPVLLRLDRIARVSDNWQRLSASLRDPARRRIAVYMETFQRHLEEDQDAAVLRHFLDDYIPNQLLPSTERALSYWGMEAAFPFADRRLKGLAQRVKTDAERNRLLRAAFADLDLPENIKTRPKLCSKQGLVHVKTTLRQGSHSTRGRLGGLLRSEFEAHCYELLEAMFLEHRGMLSSELLSALSGLHDDSFSERSGPPVAQIP